MVDNIGNCISKIRMSVVELEDKVVPAWPWALYFISKCYLCCKNFLRFLRPSDMMPWKDILSIILICWMLAVFQTLSCNQENISNSPISVMMPAHPGSQEPIFHLSSQLSFWWLESAMIRVFTGMNQNIPQFRALLFFFFPENCITSIPLQIEVFFLSPESEAQKSNFLNEFNFEFTHEFLGGKAQYLLI